MVVCCLMLAARARAQISQTTTMMTTPNYTCTFSLKQRLLLCRSYTALPCLGEID